MGSVAQLSPIVAVLAAAESYMLIATSLDGITAFAFFVMSRDQISSARSIGYQYAVRESRKRRYGE